MKEICFSFRSHCKCRLCLLFLQGLILLAIFLGTCVSGVSSERVFLSAGTATGLLLVFIECLWCRKCPFFLEKMAYFQALGFLLIMRMSRTAFCMV